MPDTAAFEPGHIEVHIMIETGRTISMRCLCERGADHLYPGSGRPGRDASADAGD